MVTSGTWPRRSRTSTITRSTSTRSTSTRSTSWAPVDQERSGSRYSYSIYQVEYSRNLVFASGARLDRTSETIVDRARSRLDVPKVRTMFGAKGCPHRKCGDLSPRQGVVIEKPAWDLTIFKVHFGLLTFKAYNKGEHVLRFEAVVHNTRQLRVGRVLDRFPVIVDRLRSMADRFLTMLDCVDAGFIADGIPDQLPTPSRLGAVRVGGIDINKTRARAVMAAAVALSVAPDGFAALQSERQSRRAAMAPCASRTAWWHPYQACCLLDATRLHWLS
ncbi:MAG: hypothetical protein ACYDH5_00015 [Acidimicrobiales bacterium]